MYFQQFFGMASEDLEYSAQVIGTTTAITTHVLHPSGQFGHCANKMVTQTAGPLF